MRRIQNRARFHTGVCVAATFLLALLMMLPALSWAQEGMPGDDTARVKTHLKEILSQPEFHPESADNPMAQFARTMRDQFEHAMHWLQDRWKAFERWLNRLFRFAGPAGATVGSVFSKAFAAVFILLGGWLIAWLIRNFWLAPQRRKAQQRTAYDEAEDSEAMITEPQIWLQQAEGFASSEDYRRAFRAVFLAILLLLDQGGLIEFDRTRTNGDYLRLLRSKNLKRLYDTLLPLVLEFDRRWYGRAETKRADYTRIQNEFERVRALMQEQPLEAAPITAAGKA